MTVFIIYGPSGTGKSTLIKEYIRINHLDRDYMYSRNTNNDWTWELVDRQEWTHERVEAAVRAEPNKKHVVVWDFVQDVQDFFNMEDTRAFYTLVKTDPDFSNVVLCIAGDRDLDVTFYIEAVRSW